MQKEEKNPSESWTYVVGSCALVSALRKATSSHHLCGFRPSSKLSGNPSIFFVNFFFPLVKINKTLNVPPFSLYDFFALGVSFLKCFPLVVDFIAHPSAFSLIIESINPQSSALLWFRKLTLFRFCESTGFCPL